MPDSNCNTRGLFARWAIAAFTLPAFLLFAGAAHAATLTLHLNGPAGSGVVIVEPDGTLCWTGTCQIEYADDAQVILQPQAQMDFDWEGWSGACTGMNDCKLTMSEARSATANFDYHTNVRVTKSGTGSGTVTSGATGIDCGATCRAGFAQGSTVTLTAVPSADSSFTGWTGACSGSGPTCSFSTAPFGSDITAIFTLLPIPLTIVTQGTGAGTVTSSPAGIACGSACAYSFVAGASVTLSQSPAPGSGFSGWSGGGCTTMAMTCTVAMSVARTVTATFSQQTFQLTVAAAGTGSGSIASAPIGIACGSVCASGYADGVSIALTATAAAGSTFTGWSGACTGIAATCTVTMSAARSVVATFTLGTRPLTVVRTGSGSGTVTASPAGIDCGANCQADVPYGTLVTLTAVAGDSSYFAGWSGPCTGMQPTCTLTVTAATSVTAKFPYLVTLTTTFSGAGGGMVYSSPAYVLCSQTCVRQAPIGDVVRLVAIADENSVFLGWSGACSGSGDCVLSMSEPRSVTAHFALLFHPYIYLDGTGRGSISSDPVGILCQDFCSDRFYSAGDVTLTAVAQPGSSFSGWAGACTGTSPTCVLPPDSRAFVQATFDLLPIHLTVASSGTGEGAITSADGSIDCGERCEADIPARKSLQITANAAPGSTFTGWSGACEGMGDCWIWDDRAISVTANFTIDPAAPGEPASPGPPPVAPAVPEPAVGPPATESTPAAQAVAPPAATGVVPTAVRTRALPTVRARPKLTGKAIVGRKLSCSRGAWAANPTRYAFTWLRDGKVVAHGASRVIHKADRGHALRCAVTVTNAGGSATATTSTVRVPH